MNYTPLMSRVRTKVEWGKWLNSLKKGDRVLIQEFVPQGSGCLESTVEGWKLYEGVYQGDTVLYRREPHPLKDGIFRYHGSEEPWGDVFAARIVPTHWSLKDLDEKLISHAPIFEPEWAEQSRCLCLALQGRDRIGAYSSIKKIFPRIYKREVEQGDLVIIFGNRDEIKSAVENIQGIEFLYSEYLDGF